MAASPKGKRPAIKSKEAKPTDGRSPLQDDRLPDRILLHMRDLKPRSVNTLLADLFGEAIKDGKKPVTSTDEQRKALKGALVGLEKQGRITVTEGKNDSWEVQALPLQEERFQIVSSFRDLIPPPAPDEDVKMAEWALVTPDDQIDPVIVWKGANLLVDGHRRHELLSLFGRKCRIEEREFESEEAARQWVEDLHYSRRNTSAEWKAYLRGRRYNAEKQGHGGDRKTAKSRAELEGARTKERLARAYGVDPTTIHRDGKFAHAVDAVSPVLGAEAVRNFFARRLAWARSDVRRLAKLAAKNKAEAMRVAEAALAAGKRPKFKEQNVQASLAKKVDAMAGRLQKEGTEGSVQLLSLVAARLGMKLVPLDGTGKTAAPEA